VLLWLAAIRLNATASDKTARHCQEKARIRPLPVSVQRRIGSSAEVALGRISGYRGVGTVGGRLVTAAAARGRCRLACHWLPRTKRPRWMGAPGEAVGWPMSRDSPCDYRALPDAPWPVIRQGSQWADPLPGPRGGGACRKSRMRSVRGESAGPCRGGWHPAAHCRRGDRVG
jgi:hypothetical protein